MNEEISVRERGGEDIDVASDDEAAEQLKELVKPWTQGGITLPQVFQGELLVTLNSARGLTVWSGIPGIVTLSSPYCELELGSQKASSRKYTEKKSKGSSPVIQFQMYRNNGEQT